MTRLICFLIFFAWSSFAFSQIQSNALKKAEGFNQKGSYRELSDMDGYFLLPQFGMRYGKSPGFQTTGIEDLSLYFGMGVGYRKRNLSLESGLSLFHHTSSTLYFSTNPGGGYIIASDQSDLVLPFTFRYDIPTGEKGISA